MISIMVLYCIMYNHNHYTTTSNNNHNHHNNTHNNNDNNNWRPRRAPSRPPQGPRACQ